MAGPKFMDVYLPPAASNCHCPVGQEKDIESNYLARFHVYHIASACVCLHVPVSAPTCLCLPPRACVCPHVPVSAPTCLSANSCVVCNCGPNAKCLKSEGGWANCVCERGLKLLPNASSTHSCSIMDCGENAYCEKEQELAVCHCNWGYTMIENSYVGPATYGSCPTLATCTRVSATIKAPYCPPGYGMTSTSCVQGALPTVSSSSFTFYDKPFYGLSPNTYTTHMDYNACTNVPLKYSSYWRVDHAPGGAGDCLKISTYTLHDCIGLMTVLYDLPLNSIEALGVG
ncbi:unnamed protein product [Closterium sp. NIES-65]|nr:unnamed protein product [Closterium sp. NIES-65]